jgi:hypothetical protein
LLENSPALKQMNNIEQSTSRTEEPDVPYSVHYKFDGDFAPINKWLAKNCGGIFDYSIEDSASEAGQMKDVILRFEKEEDRARFKNMILAGFVS